MSGSLAKRPQTWLATCFGIGRMWPAPGTWGSLFGLLIFAFALWPLPLFAQLLAWMILTVAGTLSAHATARVVGAEDPSVVVIDEAAAMWLAAAGIRSGTGLFLAFLYFRVFDIIKPFPGRWAEGLRGGVGIMADDVVAALYAQAGVWLTLWALATWRG